MLTVSILSLFFSSVQIAFINENTQGYLEKAGLLKLIGDICIKKGTVPGTLKYHINFLVMYTPVQKVENAAVGIRHADYVAPSIHKSWH
jgi:hypothetical protein